MTGVQTCALPISLGVLVHRTDAALGAGAGGATRGDRYVVTWNDAHYIGSQGYGLVSELERRGWTVGVPDTWRIPVTRQRVVPDDRADVTTGQCQQTGEKQLFHTSDIAHPNYLHSLNVIEPFPR